MLTRLITTRANNLFKIPNNFAAKNSLAFIGIQLQWPQNLLKVAISFSAGVKFKLLPNYTLQWQ